jgi:hypothetical protein
MPNGEAVVRLRIPIRLAPLTNVYARMHWIERTKIKHECLLSFLSQHARFSRPLERKALIRSVRFSKSPPDPEASWMKIPLDCLKQEGGGLGVVRDDSPKYVELHCSWERSQKSSVTIEVYAL